MGLSESVCRNLLMEKGWRRGIADPSSYLDGNLEFRAQSSAWAAELSGHCVASVKTLWSITNMVATPAELSPVEMVSETGRDSLDIDAADDFVCADRMMALWFGKHAAGKMRKPPSDGR